MSVEGAGFITLVTEFSVSPQNPNIGPNSVAWPGWAWLTLEEGEGKTEVTLTRLHLWRGVSISYRSCSNLHCAAIAPNDQLPISPGPALWPLCASGLTWRGPLGSGYAGGSGGHLLHSHSCWLGKGWSLGEPQLTQSEGVIICWGDVGLPALSHHVNWHFGWGTAAYTPSLAQGSTQCHNLIQNLKLQLDFLRFGRYGI